MKTSILFCFLFLLPVLSYSQKKGIRILPEIGFTNPIGDFREVNTFATPGLQYGLNVEKMWGKIGFGLYVGIDKNNIKTSNILPQTNTGISIIQSNHFNQNYWKQFQFGIGPILNLDISKKFNLEFTSKFGLSDFSYPDFRQLGKVGAPLNQTYTLYETNNEEIEKNLYPMLLTTTRLNFKLSSKLDLALSASYKNVRNVRHAYSYLDGEFDQNMSNEELKDALLSAPTVSRIRECYFNSFGVSLGVSYTFGDMHDNENPDIDTTDNNTDQDSCLNPLIRNSGFAFGIYKASGVPYWITGYGSPKFVNTSGSGFLDNGHVEASGNVSNGDAIVQTLNPNTKIRQGKKYLLSACVRFYTKENKSEYARVRAIAFNGALPVIGNKHPNLNSNLSLIGRSTKIKDCGDWVDVEFFVWVANKDFDHVALNVFTDDGTIAKVWIDNVSLCEVNFDPCAEIQLNANNQPIRPHGLPPPPVNFACTSVAEEVEYENGNLSNLYGGAPYFYDGTTNWYTNALDKCFSIGGDIPDEVNNYNCDDTLKMAGINMTCAELEKLLTNPDLSKLEKYKPPKMPPIPDLPKGPSCIQLPDDMGNIAFAGKDIIYIHGLELGHVMDRITGLKNKALSNWPASKQEFYGNGYYKKAAEKTWFYHINYFTNNPLIPENQFRNRHLVVAYNCSQRLDVAVHSVLTQIREAMANGTGVVSQGDPRGKNCFGKEFVIISQSTGAMVADVLLTIANDTKSSPLMAAKYGNLGYIADRCKGHVARRGAFTGSDLATILVALAKPTPGATAIATALLLQDGDIFKDLSDAKNLSIIRSSILVDLIPLIARTEWGPYIDRVPVKVLTVSGGHPTFFSKEQIDLLIAAAPIFGGVVASNFLKVALSMKYIVHPGFDDGVITTDCASGRKSTFTTPSTFQASNPIKAFDMGIPKIRAIGYFLDQKKKTDLNTFLSGATPYLSPTGMVQPVSVSSINLNHSYKNHFTFLQAAGEHWIKKDILSCDYSTTAISGDRNFEEQLVVNDAACFNPTSGIISPSIISLMKEEIRGKSIPIYYIKFRKVKGIPRPTIASRPFWIWKRTYHNLVQPNYQLSSQGCQLDCDYVYKYLFKN